MKLSLLALPVIGMFTHTAFAGGLIEQLPADGTWVKFDFIPPNDSSSKGEPETQTLTMSSVGVVTVDGEKCRWIELKIVPKTKGYFPQLVKFLVPERFLTANEDPMRHILKLGQTYGFTMPPNDTLVKADWNDNPVANTVPYHTLFRKPLAAVVSLPNVTVETKLGNLDCSVVTGRCHDGGNGIVSLQITQETQLHKKAPFGVVTIRVTTEVIQDGVVYEKGTRSLKLVDAGINAKSEMLDPP